MEEHKKFDYDSDIIICEDLPETISLSTSPEKKKKPKTKKRKRKVKRGVNFNSNMETLLITQKLKKTKFKCVININTVCKRSDSIVRFDTNVCKKDAYYHRIVPICLREMCSGSGSCCRSTISRDYNKYVYPKTGSVSPVSSIPLTEVFSCNNISYEDVSNGSFSCVSEEELDTLIKRTRQREKQFHNSHSARNYITSTPTPKADIASPFSIDIDKNSIHSDNTMILNPLSTEAYSPTSFDTIKINNLETDDATNIDIDIPYSPTMTPDLIKMENLDYSPVDRTIQDVDIPYSPTYTPETITVDMDDLKRNSINLDMYLPCSPTFTPDIEMENSGSANIEYGNEPYSPTMTPDMIKMENLNYSVDRTDASVTINVGYSPRSPTVTPDFHIFTVTQTDNSNKDIQDVLYSPSSESMKQDYLDGESTIIRNTKAPKFAILTPDQIKKENEKRHDYSNEIDYNMNNTIHCKSEKDDHQMHDQADPSEIIVKIEKDDRTNVNHVYSAIFKNNVIKTEDGN